MTDLAFLAVPAPLQGPASQWRYCAWTEDSKYFAVGTVTGLVYGTRNAVGCSMLRRSAHFIFFHLRRLSVLQKGSVKHTFDVRQLGLGKALAGLAFRRGGPVDRTRRGCVHRPLAVRFSYVAFLTRMTPLDSSLFSSRTRGKCGGFHCPSSPSASTLHHQTFERWMSALTITALGPSLTTLGQTSSPSLEAPTLWVTAPRTVRSIHPSPTSTPRSPSSGMQRDRCLCGTCPTMPRILCWLTVPSMPPMRTTWPAEGSSPLSLSTFRSPRPGPSITRHVVTAAGNNSVLVCSPVHHCRPCSRPAVTRSQSWTSRGE